MEEKKRKGRRAYLDSFQKNRAGEYEYTGKTYLFSGSDPDTAKKEFDRMLRKMWLCGLGLIVALIAAGCIRVPGMSGCFYVLIPYAACIVEGFRTCWALGRVTSNGRSLKEYVYESSAKVLPRRAGTAAVCAGLSLAGELIFVLQNGFDGMAFGFLAFLILCAAEMAAAGILHRCAGAMKGRFAADLHTND